MIDFIRIVAPIEPQYSFNSIHPFEWQELIFVPKFKKGILKGFESEYKDLRVVLYYDKIELSNSLHKFYKGNNYTDFAYSELVNAIAEICIKFEIEAEYWEIKKMEFGFNIKTPQPANEYIDLFLEYKERKFDKMKNKQIDYGRKCFLSEYSLKVYDKSYQSKVVDSIAISKKMLRVEFCYNQKRKLPEQIKNLADLMDREKIKELYNDLSEAFAKVIFSEEVDFTGSTDEERMLFFASTHANYIKVEEGINKSNTKAMKKRIKQLKERFFRKTFKKWFLKALQDKYIELYCN
ncbi:hypothetical protein ACLI1A_10855 [Flavobacterium sp. RHBU_3]|uniref:hypothetical protein n=1 Tax=Flavobacterium sp. RHBU_3 TaxID=3391184 RepID=UPI0039852482